MQWTLMGSSLTRLPVLLTLIVTTGLGLSMAGAQTSSQSATSKIRPIANDILRWKGAAKLRLWSDPKGSRGEGMVLLPGGHLLVAKEKKPATLIEFGPPQSRSRGLVRGGALADGERWSIKKGHHRFVALAIWFPDKTLAKTCADFSDLEIGPDGCLYLLSDKSATIARLDDLPAGGGTALLDA